MSITTDMNAAGLALPPRDRLSHAYILISGARNRLSLARQLAAHMLCENGGESPCGICPSCRKVTAGIHPDVVTVERPTDDKGKPKKFVQVEQIRDILSDSVVLPNEAKYKVYVILDGEFMNDPAQNALLKLLEEPPTRVRFILCSENPGAFLDTIRSRCIELSAPTEEDTGDLGLQRRYLTLAAGGDPLALLKFSLELEEYSSPQLEEFIHGARVLIGRALAGKEPDIALPPKKLMEIHDLLTRCLEYMQVNVSVKQVLSLMSVSTAGHIRN